MVEFNPGKDALNLSARRFIHCRQFKRLSQCLGRFVNQKSGPIGGDLKENSARLPKIDRMKILPIDYRRDIETTRDQSFPYLQLFLIVGRAKCDVMDGSNCNVTKTGVGRDNLNFRSGI